MQITRINLVPTLVNFMIKSPHVKDYDLSSVEAATCGAAPLSRESELEFVKKLKIPRLAQGNFWVGITLLNVVQQRYDFQQKRRNLKDSIE